MKMDVKKTDRLRNKLPIVDIYDAAQEREKGREWFRVNILAEKEGVSSASILNWIKNKKLEGCVLCGVIHARRLQSQGGQENEQPATKSESS